MANHYIKFYPVGNGDTTLITLSDNTTILIDCKLRTSAEDEEDKEKYDVKKDLLESIKKRDNNPFVDVFILTHPDQDHCLGFSKNFYCGDPSKYKKENRDNDEIIIDELWATSMLFDVVTNDDAKALKKEAERRRKLWDEDSAEKDKPGNRICMIGYNGDEKFENVEAYVPGNTITEINNKVQTNFEFFVHSPFKKTLIVATSEKDKNYSSIVMQARFKVNASDKDFATFFLFGGDADHYSWKEVLDKSKKHKNEDKLNWDIFLSPHHCSWTYFNDVPYDEKEENKTPKKSSLDILDYKVGKGKIVASSKVISKHDKNPPHWEAKQQYLKKLDSNDNFLELAKIPSEDEPKPVIFKITPQGPVRDDSKKQGSSAVSAGGSLGAVKSKGEYGSETV